MARAYYNEIDAYAAAWLRNLIAAGHIAPGDVDERSIVDVRPDDLKGYTQCHFFAGIGGWSYAARLAGWPDDRPLWTGSCPCQPFSALGQRKAFADPRHLWPDWHRLIAKCSPAVVFGEQVESPDGREWLSRVRADMEVGGYAFGAACLPAASVASPQRRYRLWFVADAHGANQDERASSGEQPLHHEDHRNSVQGLGGAEGEPLGRVGQPWEPSAPIECDDGWRRIEPGAQPLVDGVPRRLDKMRGYGNAIVPQVAAEVIGAYLDTELAA